MGSDFKKKTIQLLLIALTGFGISAPFVVAQTPEFPPTVFAKSSPEEVALGRFLFFDPIISGNQNIACATCHHPRFGTSDGVSLALGDGGIGLGPDRRVDPENLPEQRIGRNAPALFNLGAKEFTSLFHDGRLEADSSRPSGIRTPLEDEMVAGFSGVLSAQAMFPVLSGDEMAGHYSENDVSKAVRVGFLAQPGGAWDIIATRVAGIPEYRNMFTSVVGPRQIRFTDISNAIAAFIAFEWRSDDSPFDRHLDGATLSKSATRGMELFYGNAGCSACHSGRFQTDHGFHAIAMPQIGPGKAARFENHHRDVGRIRVTGQAADVYKFRTPSLRNITLSAPYGHSGAYATLDAVVRHHLDPVASLMAYDRTQATLPKLVGASDWAVLDSPAEMARIADANELEPVQLSDVEIGQIIQFLNALTDDKARLGVPTTVPSGLPVD
ncbi:MAG: cytochrome-c peroxidase [Rhodobacteraceae bacterium]|nr:cytochrome-c peroxidase [Paracoccaceae bacterium]